MKDFSPVSRVKRVRHEIRMREVEVVRAQSISPGFVAVTFGGDAFVDFVSESFDDHIKFIFTGENGEPVRRDYTPRHFDSRTHELTIEFGIHGGGPGALWARQAAPGQKVVIGGPRGSLVIPKDYQWHLLIGDAAALPAIARRLEELPPEAKVIVKVYVPDVSDRREFAGAESLDVQWVSTPDELVSAVRAMSLPPEEGFTWCAGEAATMARLRKILVEEKGVSRETMRIGAYWKQGDSDFHETLVTPSGQF